MVYGKSDYTVDHVSLTGATGDGLTTDGAANARWQLLNCMAYSNTARGFDFNTDFTTSYIYKCIAYDNTDGFYGQGSGLCLFCIARNNSATGWGNIRLGVKHVGCLAYENTSDNFSTSQGQSSFINCVGDSSTNGSGIITGGSDASCLIIGCRLTNNGAYGIEMTETVDDSTIENWNVFHGNNSGGTGLDLLAVISGYNSYGNGANHISDPPNDGFVNSGTDHYEVTGGALLSARNAADEIELNWDGEPATNNSAWITAGLPIEAPAGGAVGAALSRVRIGM
jgi:hypothetical protein